MVSFRNLGKDACLIVPCEAEHGEQERGANYAHLAAFVRTAPREQVRIYAQTKIHDDGVSLVLVETIVKLLEHQICFFKQLFVFRWHP